MEFEIKSRPNILAAILPEAVPLPKFALFSKLELNGVAVQVIGVNYYHPIAAEQLELPAGWNYQLSDGSPLVAVLSEQELIDSQPINEIEVIALAA